jgi:hypothetical protein
MDIECYMMSEPTCGMWWVVVNRALDPQGWRAAYFHWEDEAVEYAARLRHRLFWEQAYKKTRSREK